MRILGLALIAWALSACASSPADPSLDAEAKLFRARTDTACIYILPSPRTQAVTITMDGRKVGNLAKENYFRLDVTPGRHVLGVERASPVPVFFRATRDDDLGEAREDARGGNRNGLQARRAEAIDSHR